ILLDELVGIGGPVFAPRLNHIQVADDQDRLQPRSGCSAILCDEILFAVVRPGEHKVFCREPGVEQPLPHRSRGGCDAAVRVLRVDLDQLLEDGPRQFAVLCRQAWSTALLRYQNTTERHDSSTNAQPNCFSAQSRLHFPKSHKFPVALYSHSTRCLPPPIQRPPSNSHAFPAFTVLLPHFATFRSLSTRGPAW